MRWRKKYLHEADVARVSAGELPPLDGKVGDVDVSNKGLISIVELTLVGSCPVAGWYHQGVDDSHDIFVK